MAAPLRLFTAGTQDLGLGSGRAWAGQALRADDAQAFLAAIELRRPPLAGQGEQRNLMDGPLAAGARQGRLWRSLAPQGFLHAPGGGFALLLGQLVSKITHRRMRTFPARGHNLFGLGFRSKRIGNQ